MEVPRQGCFLSLLSVSQLLWISVKTGKLSASLQIRPAVKYRAEDDTSQTSSYQTALFMLSAVCHLSGVKATEHSSSKARRFLPHLPADSLFEFFIYQVSMCTVFLCFFSVRPLGSGFSCQTWQKEERNAKRRDTASCSVYLEEDKLNFILNEQILNKFQIFW